MKQRLLLLAFAAVAGCSTTQPVAGVKSSTALNGTWIPVRQEIGGRELPVAVYQTQQLTIADSTYTLQAESTDKGIVQYNNGKMDIYGREGVNKGKHFTALYKYESGLLTVCYNLAGSGYPPTFDTKGNPLFFLAVFKKQ